MPVIETGVDTHTCSLQAIVFSTVYIRKEYEGTPLYIYIYKSKLVEGTVGIYFFTK